MLLTLILLVIVGIACLLGASCSYDRPELACAQTPVTRRNIRSLSKEQIQDKLRTLEVSESPMRKMGAMCYVPTPCPDRAEYVCPKCGEKTIYSNDNGPFIDYELEACRREFKLLKSASELSLTLNESSFCAHCSPKAKEHQLVLIVNYADGSKHSTAPISREDLRILRCFLAGQLSYKTFYDGIDPLKDELPRLRKLLGVDNKTEKQGD